mmetsp:Transcript_4292/g.6071  ORF Transcript_4292/g.6071 Transcript_4292/m.6071 type:complete len:185 (-) Transcript_4292:1098-1652(-)|eukprot:CAMPEP_0197288246 /NCGR_PEP_ID=MMETSP0890-20130614/5263_1 /TAXON_ID=44058 ORGANISM="Aureoumbra lagunensis, Strain CCMP1510" /NCGR_SAMPLE_ID=MMETSP0890 /ASSEMBLY_ACC=CAM_ASM_000533 /LENGTH=184 /DNA_ID=CAMNT_0042758815 /DNA_START=97 /DNA_END=651 /DNA_ORIENTATION=-
MQNIISIISLLLSVLYVGVIDAYGGGNICDAAPVQLFTYNDTSNEYSNIDFIPSDAIGFGFALLEVTKTGNLEFEWGVNIVNTIFLVLKYDPTNFYSVVGATVGGGNIEIPPFLVLDTFSSSEDVSEPNRYADLNCLEGDILALYILTNDDTVYADNITVTFDQGSTCPIFLDEVPVGANFLGD